MATLLTSDFCLIQEASGLSLSFVVRVSHAAFPNENYERLCPKFDTLTLCARSSFIQRRERPYADFRRKREFDWAKGSSDCSWESRSECRIRGRCPGWPPASRSFAMPKITSTVAKTPEDLADSLGLPRAAAREWQFQHVLLARLKQITQREKITHAEIAKRAGTSRTRVTSILNDDLRHVSSDLLIRILGSLGYRVKVSVVRSDNAA